MQYVALKVNTTGLDPEKDDITEISVLFYDGEKVSKEFHSLITPDSPFSEEAQKISGITEEMLINYNAPKFIDIKDEVLNIIRANPILGHNVSFDLAFLNKYFESSLENITIDTLRIAKAILSYTDVPNYKFSTLCNFFNINNVKYIRTQKIAYDTCDLFNIMLPKLVEKKNKLEQLKSEARSK